VANQLSSGICFFLKVFSKKPSSGLKDYIFKDQNFIDNKIYDFWLKIALGRKGWSPFRSFITIN
jgi:hypothetical protein